MNFFALFVLALIAFLVFTPLGENLLATLGLAEPTMEEGFSSCHNEDKEGFSSCPYANAEDKEGGGSTQQMNTQNGDGQLMGYDIDVNNLAQFKN